MFLHGINYGTEYQNLLRYCTKIRNSNIMTTIFYTYSRFLAAGDAYTTIAYNYRAGVSLVSKVVADVAQAIWDMLVDEQMRPPTNAEWKEMAEGFERKWNFPNCNTGSSIIWLPILQLQTQFLHHAFSCA